MGDADYIAAVSHSNHQKYSPNLHRWLLRQGRRWPTPLVTGLGPSPFDGVRTWLMVGWRDEDGWFMGSAVRRILCDGLKTECYAYSPEQVSAGGDGFWPEYLKDGRCALDRDHSRYFLSAENRFTNHGDTRTCNWCGAEQHLKRWTETVECERWEMAA